MNDPQNQQVPQKAGEQVQGQSSGKSSGGVPGTISRKAFNLVPRRHVKRQERKSMLLDINVYAAAAIFLMIAIAAALVGVRYYFEAEGMPKREEIAEKWNQAVSMQDVEWKASAVSERVDTLSAITRDKIDIFDVLDRIEETTSVDFSWETVVLDENLTLSARLTNMDDALVMLHEISQLTDYTEVRTDSLSQNESTLELPGYVLITFTVVP